ncbi:MAG TPA: class I SAM-dependent methyltransferase [Thermoanaerobaculia bacterium]|nr:class I SAM-dependent methyltransferase [Thermoanaerobaculia bacterium]
MNRRAGGCDETVPESYFAASIKRYYDSSAAEVYAERTALLPAEEAVLRLLREELAGARLLDVGVGPGRTIPHLRALCRSYAGIDYSANMLRHARRRYPGCALLLGDARALPFAGGGFDTVFFCNAIDDVGHEDRLRILREVHAALRTSGVFVFSAHNSDAPLPSPLAFPSPSPSPSGAAGGRTAWLRGGWGRLRRYGRGIRNHLRLRPHQRRTAEYRIMSDHFCDHGLLTYYISRPAQVRQLAALGFTPIQTLGADGRLLSDGEACQDAWIFYVARKAASSAGGGS